MPPIALLRVLQRRSLAHPQRVPLTPRAPLHRTSRIANKPLHTSPSRTKPNAIAPPVRPLSPAEWSPTNAVWLLAGANVAVACMWIRASRSTAEEAVYPLLVNGLTSARHLHDGMYHSLLTSVFSHLEVSHLVSNTLGLVVFGRGVARVLGPCNFVRAYLASGVASSWVAVQSRRQLEDPSPTLGASGAVNTVAALSVGVTPRQTLKVLAVLPVRMWLAGLAFIAPDVLRWHRGERNKLCADPSGATFGAVCGGILSVLVRRRGRGGGLIC